MFRHLTVVALCLVAAAAAVSVADASEPPLLGPVVADAPPAEAFAVRAPIPSTTRLRVTGLRRGVRYEARASYLGSPALRVAVRVLASTAPPTPPVVLTRSGSGDDAAEAAASARRRLLDTEKAFLEATGVEFDAPDADFGVATIEVAVAAGATLGLEWLPPPPPPGAAAAAAAAAAGYPFEAHYVVTVESLLGGAVPRTAVPLVGVAACLLAAVGGGGAWWLFRRMEQMATASDKAA